MKQFCAKVNYSLRKPTCIRLSLPTGVLPSAPSSVKRSSVLSWTAEWHLKHKLETEMSLVDVAVNVESYCLLSDDLSTLKLCSFE